MAWLLLLLVALASLTCAENILRSTSLNACQDNSQYTASLLNLIYTPQNNSAYVHIVGVSSIEGYAIFDITITVYGYDFLHKTVDPCQIGLPGLCPMIAAKTDSPPFRLPVSNDAEAQIPGIAYTFPDLDAKVRVYINMTSGDQAGHAAACLELNVSNGRTVDLLGVQWASALVVLAALVASAAIGQLGHFNAASHVVVHTLALFGYFQAQAIVGLCGMPLPPIVQAWTQNFQWTLGLIKLEFMQSILTWYQRATGGTPSRLFDSLSDVSVAVQKRTLLVLPATASRALRRGVVRNDSGSFVVFGIQRAAFRAGIEPTNTFLTMIGFFVVLLFAAAISVIFMKIACEAAVRARWVNGRSERTLEFRNGWRTILKGVLFRCLLAAYPAVVIACLYEFTQADSPAEIVDAVMLLLASSVALGYGAYTVIRIASRSIGLHRNPAYILFSDPRTLNKWGCFYVQFRASGYYFAVPVLVHTLLKAAFIAFAQHSSTAQAVGLIVIEAAAFIGAIALRPWMDKSTNSFNITICVVNFINAVILLIFSNVFKQPPLGTGIVGLIFWVLNAAVTLILLLMIIITTIIIFFRNNPDARYQYMADDRTSFVKSQVHLASTELDALAATARGNTPAQGTATGNGKANSSISMLGNNSGIAGPRGANNLHNHPGLGGGPRDRLLMLDDADETDSIVSDFRHPNTTMIMTNSASAALGRRRSPAPFASTPSPAPFTSSPSPAPSATAAAAATAAMNHRSNSRAYRDSVDSREGYDGHEGGTATGYMLPPSPATPSVPMLPANQRYGMQSPGSPMYGFSGSRSARNTPSPAQQRIAHQQNTMPGSMSAPHLPPGITTTPTGYRQVSMNGPEVNGR